MGCPSAPMGTGGQVALRGLQAYWPHPRRAHPSCWFTTLLWKCHWHFLVSVPLLIHSISTSRFGSWFHFHPNDFSPLITPPRISPGVTQSQLVPSLCSAGGVRYLLLQAEMTPTAARFWLCGVPQGFTGFTSVALEIWLETSRLAFLQHVGLPCFCLLSIAPACIQPVCLHLCLLPCPPHLGRLPPPLTLHHA